jgi:hypothetical protein
MDQEEPIKIEAVSVHSQARVFHNYASTDARKVFVSRVPKELATADLKALIEQEFSVVVQECDLMVEKVEKTEEGEGDDADEPTDAGDSTAEPPVVNTQPGIGKKEKKKKKKKQKIVLHLGYGYVLLADEASAALIVAAAVMKTADKHTVHFAAVTRKANDDETDQSANKQGVCFLWKKGTCTHGDRCVFAHEGEGSCAVARGEGVSKKICFDWKKKGKCSKGDKCEFLHTEDKKGVKRPAPDAEDAPRDVKSTHDKDCFEWKKKGKCRKGDKCPYKHDVSVQVAALIKKKAKTTTTDGKSATKVAAMQVPAPTIPSNEVVALSFSGGSAAALKRSEVEKILKACDCPKPKRVSVSDEGVEVTFKSSRACEDAMLIMWNDVNRTMMGGDSVVLDFARSSGITA